MIQNMKLYVTLTGAGSQALRVRLWTRSSVSYQATVPMPRTGVKDINKLRSVFSSIRSNFTGLNEEDWLSFDALLEQLLEKDDTCNALPLAMSLASARAATTNELWKLNGETNKFPYIAAAVTRGNVWREFIFLPTQERTITDAFRAIEEASKVLGHAFKEHGVLRGSDATGAWLSDLGETETLYLANQVARDWNMGLGIRFGASSFWDGRYYDYSRDLGNVIRNKKLTEDEHTELVSAVMEHYNIEYADDAFRDDDFMSHAKLLQKFNNAVISGTDLFRADISRIKEAYKFRPVNTINISPGHIRTVTQLLEIAKFARNRSIKLSLSRLPAETGDDWLSDLCLAAGADFIKLGVGGVGNTSKYSRLLQMWEDATSPRIGRFF
ncbi:MAG: hypothetical protein J7K54_03665 [Candidatus Aenigmarchaeota archaeon]|nr:hypothetical protein [Candidatus Aenigmarchaeota archaeon]